MIDDPQDTLLRLIDAALVEHCRELETAYKAAQQATADATQRLESHNASVPSDATAVRAWSMERTTLGGEVNAYQSVASGIATALDAARIELQAALKASFDSEHNRRVDAYHAAYDAAEQAKQKAHQRLHAALAEIDKNLHNGPREHLAAWRREHADKFGYSPNSNSANSIYSDFEHSNRIYVW